MQIVATFAKRGGDDREVRRTIVISVPVEDSSSSYLYSAVCIAIYNCRRGERVVKLAEGGYQ